MPPPLLIRTSLIHNVALADLVVAFCVNIDRVCSDRVKSGRVVIDRKCFRYFVNRTIGVGFRNGDCQIVFVAVEFFHRSRRGCVNQSGGRYFDAKRLRVSNAGIALYMRADVAFDYTLIIVQIDRACLRRSFRRRLSTRFRYKTCLRL